LYGTLIYVSSFLSDELESYSNQGLPAPRHKDLAQALTEPILHALDAESAKPEQLLGRLNVVHEALFPFLT
jgi:hypothetical protein